MKFYLSPLVDHRGGDMLPTKDGTLRSNEHSSGKNGTFEDVFAY